MKIKKIAGFLPAFFVQQQPKPFASNTQRDENLQKKALKNAFCLLICLAKPKKFVKILTTEKF